MLKNLSVKQKIYAGFATVLFLLVVISFVGYSIIGSSSDGFEQYRGWAKNANTAGRVQANLLESRLSAKNFFIEGLQKDVDTFQEHLEATEGFLADAQKNVDTPEREGILKKLEGNLNTYHDAFYEVVTLMQKRKQLEDKLNTNGPQMERNLSEVMLTANRDRDLVAAYRAGTALRSLLLARLYVIKYLEKNQQDAYQRVNSEYADFEQELNTLDSEVQNSSRRQLISDIKGLAREYKTDFNNVYSVISDRNEIIENKLDKIGPEISSLVEEVKLSYKNDQDKLGPELQASNDRGIMLIIVFSLIALAMGVAASVLISRPIVQPVNELVSVAQAVADGDLNQSLILDQNDEIGTLAETINGMVTSLKKADDARIENDRKVKVVLDEVSATA
ncbi:MAG: methyl-accepting chemotaxis protein, partial [Calditrichaeota bacterium]|nr:methyl-accepting chemotaxis protein [Calditrichota bacterium]